MGVAKRPSNTPKSENMHKAAESLRKFAAHTTGLPDDSPTDARLRDRMEFGADVLDAVGGAEENDDKDRRS